MNKNRMLAFLMIVVSLMFVSCTNAYYIHPVNDPPLTNTNSDSSSRLAPGYYNTAGHTFYHPPLHAMGLKKIPDHTSGYGGGP